MTTQVSLEIGELEEVIRAYDRLLDIKSKHFDAEVREAAVVFNSGQSQQVMWFPQGPTISVQCCNPRCADTQ